MQAPTLPPIPAQGSSEPDKAAGSKPSRMRRWSSQLASLGIRCLLCKLCNYCDLSDLFLRSLTSAAPPAVAAASGGCPAWAASVTTCQTL